MLSVTNALLTADHRRQPRTARARARVASARDALEIAAGVQPRPAELGKRASRSCELRSERNARASIAQRLRVLRRHEKRRR
eukprot:2989247-Pleurochrysis_carterae.AAC.1